MEAESFEINEDGGGKGEENENTKNNGGEAEEAEWNVDLVLIIWNLDAEELRANYLTHSLLAADSFLRS